MSSTLQSIRMPLMRDRCMSASYECFVSGNGPPASAAINEDVGEADGSGAPAVGTGLGVYATNYGDASVTEYRQIAELERRGRPRGQPLQHCVSRDQFATPAGVGELGRKDARKRRGIAPLQRVNPVILGREHTLRCCRMGWAG